MRNPGFYQVLAMCMMVALVSIAQSQECWNNGDVTQDLMITAGDAQLGFQISLGVYVPTFEEACAADCNGDDNITAGDAQAIFLAALSMGECADPLIPPTPTSTPTTGPMSPGDLIAHDPIVGNMRYVPAGTFTQGSPSDEPCRESNETQFTHTLTRNLAVMETEITRQMWADLIAVQATLPIDPSITIYSPTLSHPVQFNAWYESVLFANLLSLQNGFTPCYYKDAGFTIPVNAGNYWGGEFHCDFDATGYRLPSEGEWEYFTRAGTTTAFSCTETNYTGDNCWECILGTHPTLEQYSWYCANSGNAGTAEAGSMLSNPWNLKDVHGNVWEWCWDWWENDYPSLSATDYTGPASGSGRVSRGGCWDGIALFCRSALRGYSTPDSMATHLGFRLLRSL